MTTISANRSPDDIAFLVQTQAVIHRYAYLARNNLKWEDLSQTFRNDAQFHLANGKTLSTSEWRQILEGGQADYIRHHLTTIDTTIRSTTEAVALVQFFALTHMSSCDHWGEWHMTVVRDADGNCLISDMKIVLDGVDPKGWAAAKYQLA